MKLMRDFGSLSHSAGAERGPNRCGAAELALGRFPGDLAVATGVLHTADPGLMNALRRASSARALRRALQLAGRRCDLGYGPAAVADVAGWLATLGDDALDEVQARLAVASREARRTALEQRLAVLAGHGGDNAAFVATLMEGAVACWQATETVRGRVLKRTCGRFGHFRAHLVEARHGRTGKWRLVSSVFGLAGHEEISLGWRPQSQWIGELYTEPVAEALAQAIGLFPALLQPELDARIASHTSALPASTGWAPVTGAVCVSPQELDAILANDRRDAFVDETPWERVLRAAQPGAPAAILEWPIDGRLREVVAFEGRGEVLAIARGWDEPAWDREPANGRHLFCRGQRAIAPASSGCSVEHGYAVTDLLEALTGRRSTPYGIDVGASLRIRLRHEGYLVGSTREMRIPVPALMAIAISGGVAFDRLDGEELLVSLPGDPGERGEAIVSPCGCQRPAATVRKAGYILPVRTIGA